MEVVLLVVCVRKSAASAVPASSFARFRSSGVRTPITVSGATVGISLL